MITQPSALASLAVYLDGADLDAMERAPSWIAGFTTNPSLLRAAGVRDYRAFARCAADVAGRRPLSLEVLADDPLGQLAEAREIATWGKNVYVKIPVVDTRGNWNGDVVQQLLAEGVPVNVTAVMTLEQVIRLREPLRSHTTPAIVSIFAGRIADTGLPPGGAVYDAVHVFWQSDNVQVLWASVRQIYDVQEAIWAGADIITLTPTLIGKLGLLGKNLEDYSVETVQQFRRDALASGLSVLPGVLT